MMSEFLFYRLLNSLSDHQSCGELNQYFTLVTALFSIKVVRPRKIDLRQK